MTATEFVDRVAQSIADDPLAWAAAFLHFLCLLVVGRRPHLGRLIGLAFAGTLMAYGWTAGVDGFLAYALSAGGYLWLLTTRHGETWRPIPTPRQVRRTGRTCQGCCVHGHRRPEPEPAVPVYAVVRHSSRVF